MKWRVDKINRFFKDTYLKYYNTFSLNKNLLISGISGFVLSLVVSHISAEYSIDFVLNFEFDSYDWLSYLQSNFCDSLSPRQQTKIYKEINWKTKYSKIQANSYQNVIR